MKLMKSALDSLDVQIMVGEQPLRPRRHLILEHKEIIPLTAPYASPGSSSAAASYMAIHTMVVI